jgi:HSP20 family molecular chaperone IbpA
MNRLAKEAEVVRQFAWGSYFRQFSLAETIDQGKIEAPLNDAVLRLELPKVERAKAGPPEPASIYRFYIFA